MTRPAGVVLAILALLISIEARAQQAPPFDQEKAVAELKAKVAGHENEPADKVFKNIQAFKGQPAARVVQMMTQAWPQSLGAKCDHCHVPGEWDKDDKPPKEATRGMMAMTQRINNELLKQVKGIKSENPRVGCSTCHRGQTKPSNQLIPPAPPKP